MPTEPTATMTTTEKLHRIRARCVELLAIAEKRTPGRWTETGIWLNAGLPANTINDRTFIAACAGAAEAGWASTVAAIDGLLQLSEPVSGDIPDEVARAYDADSELANDALNAIIAAWPEELL